MKKNYIYLIVYYYLAFQSCTVAQKVAQPVPTPDTTKISLLFAGDVMGHMPQINAAFDSSTGIYDFNPVFELVKPIVSKADIAVANLETTLAGKPFSGYPQFSSPDSLASALKNAGFDVLITANNHCLDRGASGLQRTISALDSLKILHAGTYVSDSARNASYPLVLTSKGIKIAILNCTYGTNGIPIPRSQIVNLIDTVQLKHDLTKAREARVDYIIVTLHWGTEYERIENRAQRSVAKFLFENGADLVIGSHPHVVQPIYKYYSNPSDSNNFNVVVYSLGNYVSNQRDRYKDGGIMINVVLQKVRQTKLIEYNYTPVWVYKGLINSKVDYRLIPIYNSDVTSDILDSTNREKAVLFFNDTKELLKDTPINLK